MYFTVYNYTVFHCSHSHHHHQFTPHQLVLHKLKEVILLMSPPLVQDGVPHHTVVEQGTHHHGNIILEITGHPHQHIVIVQALPVIVQLHQVIMEDPHFLHTVVHLCLVIVMHHQCLTTG